MLADETAEWLRNSPCFKRNIRWEKAALSMRSLVVFLQNNRLSANVEGLNTGLASVAEAIRRSCVLIEKC